MVKEAEPAEGKIAYVFRVCNMKNADGSRMYPIPQIAEACNISERTVRGYIYRCRHPAEYAAIVQRYFANKKQNGQQPSAAPKQKTPAALAKLPQRRAAVAEPERKLTAAERADIKQMHDQREAEYAAAAKRTNEGLQEIRSSTKRISTKAAREKLAELAVPTRKTKASAPLKAVKKAVLPKRK